MKLLKAFLFFIALINTAVAQDADADTIAAPYEIDLSKTNFRLNSYSKSPMYFYTEFGRGNPFGFPFPDHFSIIDKTGQVSNLKDFVESIIKICKTGLKVLNSLKEKESKINGYKAYEISFSGRIDETFFKTYMVVLSNGKTTLLFTGRAITDYDAMINEYKNIVRTIKIK